VLILSHEFRIKIENIERVRENLNKRIMLNIFINKNHNSINTSILICKILQLYHLFDLELTQEEIDRMVKVYIKSCTNNMMYIATINPMINLLPMLIKLNMDLEPLMTAMLKQLINICHTGIDDIYELTVEDIKKCKLNIALINNYAVQGNVVLNKKILHDVMAILKN
jgi:hypothetical protein